MWNKLSMADRAKYIKLAVENGVTDINNIREVYNSYAEGGDMSNTTSAEGQIVKTDKHLNANNVSDVLRFYYSEDPNDYRDISRKEFEDFMAKNNVGYNDYVFVKEVDPIDYVQPQELPEFTVTGKKASTEESIASVLNNASPDINRNLTPFERYMNDAIADRKIANDLYKDAYYKINGIQGIMDTRTDLWKEHGDALKKYFDPWETGMEMTREFVGDAGWFIPGISQAYTYDSMMKNAQKSIQSNDPIYSTALGMVRDSAFGKLGDMIEIGEALRNPTPENLTKATNRIRQGNKVSTNKAQASKIDLTSNPYIQDILHPKETWKAIREKRYIPFMSSKRKRAVADEIKKDLEENLLPAAKERFVKKQMALSKRFVIPTNINESSFDKVVPLIGYKKEIGMPKEIGGRYMPLLGSGVITIGLDNTPHILNSIEETRRIYSHEMDHHAQNLLRMADTTPLTKEYLTSLFISGNVNDVKANRGPLTEWDIGDEYAGIPKYALTMSDNNEYNPIENEVTNYPTEFNILAEKNTNHTWESSPREVISEVSGYIDTNPEIRGRVYNELSGSDKMGLITFIANRFNLTSDEAYEMLEKASEDGYLANGGKLNLSINNSNRRISKI